MTVPRTSGPVDSGLPAGRAERLNHGCFCVTLDQKKLAKILDEGVGQQGFSERLNASHPTLFANSPVFVPSAVLASMARIVDAIEAAVRLPDYKAAALSSAPDIAKHDFGSIGAFMGYDFHLTPDGPKLIEVNTNAGGAFLNAYLARAQRACCGASLAVSETTPSDIDEEIARMFKNEWRLQRGTGNAKLIAIVDDGPEQQHLFPEFRLAKALLEKQGFETVIADASEIRLEGHRLTISGRPIDLVYNRLVDFTLDEPRHAALRDAYTGDGVVLTPNPHLHALFADKRNLAILSDPVRLKNWGLEERHAQVLESGVLKTAVVSADNADELWRSRNELFFKPAGGYGSKAAYRGKKLTRRVWEEIITKGSYVAQAYAPPGTRGVLHDGERTELKIDVRLYSYGSRVLLAAARLYQGQTTNMRTPGGGFAPVLEVRDIQD